MDEGYQGCGDWREYKYKTAAVVQYAPGLDNADFNEICEGALHHCVCVLWLFHSCE